jgi:predicted HD superfamily hydrolase involved in NAD metabolism
MNQPTGSPVRTMLSDFEASGNVGHDALAFLTRHNCPRTAEHCRRVAAESRRIALLVGSDAAQAEAAGWLHDISAVFPSADRAEIARRLGLEVLPEEDACPLIVHQKLSAVLARELFGIVEAAVLNAVGCHTTLKRKASVLDKVLFVADKLEWDGVGVSPYRAAMLDALDHSLDQAACYYLHSLFERRESLPVIHPWLVAAHRELCGCI